MKPRMNADGRRWKTILCGLLLALNCFAAVEGVVMNVTTGKPAPSVTVNLVQPGSQGMQTLGTATSDPQGRFSFAKEIPPGPAMLQGVAKGVTYTLMLAPGAPTTGLRLNIFDTSDKPGTIKTSQHLILLEPGAEGISVSETFLVSNQTQTTYQNASRGTVQFFVPKDVKGDPEVSINTTGGMPIKRPAERAGQPGMYKINYPAKPGDTRFDVTYSLPPSERFSGKRVGDETLRLVTPAAVSLAGDGLKDMGQEPETQARLYEITGKTFDVTITGTGSLHNEASNAPQEDTGAPQVEEGQARIYTRMWAVLGLAFGILFLGGFLLYRKGSA